MKEQIIGSEEAEGRFGQSDGWTMHMDSQVAKYDDGWLAECTSSQLQSHHEDGSTWVDG